MLSSRPLGPSVDAVELLPLTSHGRGGLLAGFGRMLGPLLAGYLLFDKAFAYLHVPATPLYIGELAMACGIVAVLSGTTFLCAPFEREPVLILLALFALWGVALTVPGLAPYGIDAVRDAALWYYCIFALLTVAAMTASAELLDRLVSQTERLLPWLLLWLPVGMLLSATIENAPSVPFTDLSVLTHKAGDVAIAATIALWYIALFTENRSARYRACWGAMALLAVILASTQNRGGMLAFLVGSAIGLMFCRNRVRLLVQGAVLTSAVLVVAATIATVIPAVGGQGREYSPDQLAMNITSIVNEEKIPGTNLSGTVDGREELWNRIIEKQLRDGLLLEGSGFGPNLAAQVNVFDDGKETLRNPHNSHLHILARMGVVGLSVWILLWLCWYGQLIVGCRRLAAQGLQTRRRAAVLSLVVVSAIHTSSLFDPQLEGPQIAILFWVMFGIGLAVTTPRSWLRHQ